MKRVKRRYLALQVECDGLPTEREFMDALWASVSKLYGEVGASLSGLSLINFDAKSKVFVVKCLLAFLPQVRASITCVTSVAAVQATVHILAISGTLKALYSNI